MCPMSTLVEVTQSRRDPGAQYRCCCLYCTEPLVSLPAHWASGASVCALPQALHSSCVVMTTPITQMPPPTYARGVPLKSTLAGWRPVSSILHQNGEGEGNNMLGVTPKPSHVIMAGGHPGGCLHFGPAGATMRNRASPRCQWGGSWGTAMYCHCGVLSPPTWITLFDPQSPLSRLGCFPPCTEENEAVWGPACHA